MSDVNVPERLANHVSTMLSINGIAEDSSEAVVVGNTEYYWWNDEICVSYTDAPHVLTLIFDPTDPDLNQGSVFNLETHRTVFVDPDKIQPFAEYLLKLLAED